MKKLFIAAFMFVSTFTSNVLADGHAIKMGVILGFTGPIESLTPAMAASAELAFKEASDSGALLGGKTISVERADSTCVDSAAATSAAEGLISGGVVAIMGADCSGVTGAIASNVAVPKGVVMISPSATSPGLSTLDDNGYFFRTAPSDARGGQILADITKDRGVKSVAITYTNNDYGKGLADVYEAAVKAHGIKVTTVAAHEDGKADYAAEVATLASAGGDAIAVIGYLDQGGKGIIQGSLDSGAFDTFILSDGMIGDSLTDSFGKALNKSFGSIPGSTGKGAGVFSKVAKAAGIDSSGPYTGESYDAAALITLAMQAGGKADRAAVQKNVMSVANAPGTKIYPGQLKKALDLLAKGKAVNYEGATGVEFTEVGEAFGSFLEKEIKGGKFKTKKQR
ncbi:MAG: branched-chain amino acid ABC transporter substrate-binding protein [Candidatus Pelagibacter sp.]|jgi:branched-chain amino acid transport system substrate-binding protein|nr:branched-chain amino acid ABC transporter substrate-binding protein [Candidatus Pelagibacter sp.]|tara:strand:+ start:606 stop:1796 length:1191 start_codon:yes stop_codon:yes gene_type:complete